MQQIKKNCSKMFAFIMAFILMFNTVGPITVKATGNTAVNTTITPIFKYNMEDGNMAGLTKEDGGITFAVSTDSNTNNKFMTLTRTGTTDSYARYYIGGENWNTNADTPLWLTMNVSKGSTALTGAVVRIRCSVNPKDVTILKVPGVVKDTTDKQIAELSETEWVKLAIKVYKTDAGVKANSYIVKGDATLELCQEGIAICSDFSKIQRLDLYVGNDTNSANTGGVLKVDNVAAWQAENYVDLFAEADEPSEPDPNPIDVAQIGGVGYTSLQEAIGAAEANDTIMLLDDVTYEGDLTITKDVTLDLNGNTLTASSAVSFGGNVVDTQKTGVLKVDSTKCVFSTSNSQMPVYNGTGYVFADITMKEKKSLEVEGESTVFNLFFKPSFDTTINTLLAGGGKAAHVNVIIRLTYNGESHDLSYNNEMIKAVYAEDSNKAFYINASGVTEFEGLTITPMVISDDLGVEWSGTTFSNFVTTNP